VSEPIGWRIAEASSLCKKIQDGTHFSPKEQLREGPYPYVTAKNVRPGGLDLEDLTFLDEAAHRVIYTRCDVREGDVLLVKDGANAGDTALNTLKVEISLLSSVCFLRPGRDLTAPYLRYYLQSPMGRRYLLGSLSGSAIRRIILQRIRSLPILVAPIQEQDRIVAAIETHFSRLDAAVASLTRAKANVKRARASVLKAAVEGRLVPTEAALARAEGRDYEPASVLLDRILTEREAAWAASGSRGKYKEPVAPETAGLPELPEGWCWASINQLFVQSLGKMLDKVKNTGTARPYLRNANVRWFQFDLSDIKTMPVEDHELDRVSVSHGDIVVCEGGEPGRAAVWTSPDESFVIQKACHRLRPRMNINSQFFVIVLREAAHSGRLSQRFTGSTIKHLTSEALVPLVVPLPPLGEQHRIVAEVDRRLSVLDALDATLDATLARCARLRQAVLKRAFEGRLVPAEAPELVPA